MPKRRPLASQLTRDEREAVIETYREYLGLGNTHGQAVEQVAKWIDADPDTVRLIILEKGARCDA